MQNRLALNLQCVDMSPESALAERKRVESIQISPVGAMDMRLVASLVVGLLLTVAMPVAGEEGEGGSGGSSDTPEEDPWYGPGEGWDVLTKTEWEMLETLVANSTDPLEYVVDLVWTMVEALPAGIACFHSETVRVAAPAPAIVAPDARGAFVGALRSAVQERDMMWRAEYVGIKVIPTGC